jgi:hypothetical protein
MNEPPFEISNPGFEISGGGVFVTRHSALVISSVLIYLRAGDV